MEMKRGWTVRCDLLVVLSFYIVCTKNVPIDVEEILYHEPEMSGN
jgi:hypothetical protein